MTEKPIPTFVSDINDLSEVTDPRGETMLVFGFSQLTKPDADNDVVRIEPVERLRGGEGATKKGEPIILREAHNMALEIQRNADEQLAKDRRREFERNQDLELADAIARIRELEIELAVKESTITNLRDANERAVKIAAEVTKRLQNAITLNDAMNERLTDLLEAYEEVVEGNRTLLHRAEKAEARNALLFKEKADAITRITELEAELVRQAEDHTPLSAIETLFMAGVNQCMADEETGGKSECPYPPDSISRHWWTRGYAHQARAFRAVELETELNEAVRVCGRAEKAEREVERLQELVTEHDGVECTKHDVLVKIAVARAATLETALREYADRTNWLKMDHDAEDWMWQGEPDNPMALAQSALEPARREGGEVQ